MIRKWLTIVREHVHQTPIFSLERVRRQHPVDERTSDFYAINSPDWINVIAVTPDAQVVLVQQYRHGLDEVTLEIPGGLVDRGEAPLAAAQRELLEETGYESTQWIELGMVSANPAFMTNRCTTFLAMDAVCTQAQQFDEHEELDVMLFDTEEIHQMVDRGEIHHSVVLSALYHWLRYQARQ